MPGKDHNNSGQRRCDRFKQVLADLAERGTKQRQAAIELNVPAQYLSDVKNGHRSLTEQFARRIAERYGVSFGWLVSGDGPEQTPRFDLDGSPTTDAVALPVFSEPIEGNPSECVDWDGSKLKISGAAAAMAARASQPYVLRIASDDVERRLRKNDLVLVSQESAEADTIAIVQHRGRIVLARRDAENGGWRAVETGSRVSVNAKIVGRCLGIVWAKM